MYFDFEENRPDSPTLSSAVSTREGVLVSIIVHLLFVIVVLVWPELPFVKAAEERRQAELEERQREERERPRDNPRFVFMQPRVEPPPRPPQRAELSDVDRRARTVERAPNPQNDLPFSRGNSAERVDTLADARVPAGPSAPEPAPAAPEPSEAAPPPLMAEHATNGYRRAETPQPQPRSTGVLADAIRNVQRYAQKESFANLQGGQNQEFGPFINFDSKGVEFGPWIARFVAQVRRNWFIPMAAMTMRGNVVITFFVHKDGRISDVSVLKPSAVEAFTLAARNAILTSNPTVPLPPEYPDDKAFFTVTFFYNESPGSP